MRIAPDRSWRALCLAGAMMIVGIGEVLAQPPQVLAGDAARYLALGDSIAAGFKAHPATQGYAFLLYQGGAFDRPPHTLFNNLAAVGATSEDVLLYQVPQALIPASEGGFQPHYVTLSVGGNDLAAILRFAATNPAPPDLQLFIAATIAAYGQHLTGILQQLSTGLPGVRIFVSNQYTIPELEAALPGSGEIVDAFNTTTAQVVAAFPGTASLVDVYSAFLGRRGLLLIERPGAGPFEAHLTNAGHRVIEKAFADVIALTP